MSASAIVSPEDIARWRAYITSLPHEQMTETIFMISSCMFTIDALRAENERLIEETENFRKDALNKVAKLTAELAAANAELDNNAKLHVAEVRKLMAELDDQHETYAQECAHLYAERDNIRAQAEDYRAKYEMYLDLYKKACFPLDNNPLFHPGA